MRPIDADKLKDEMNKVFFNDNDDMNRIEQIIDNAPTIEFRLFKEWKCTDCEEREKSFYDGWQSAKERFERPQGEWEESHIISCGKILQMQLDVIEHKCKNCGRYSIKWVRTIPDNFCPNCGADMRGENNG